MISVVLIYRESKVSLDHQVLMVAMVQMAPQDEPVFAVIQVSEACPVLKDSWDPGENPEREEVIQLELKAT